MKTLLEKFFEKVEKQQSGCWEWQGLTDNNGYGRFNFDGKQSSAHRFSAKYLGNSIIDKMIVCHKCDNPGCVNPDHLFVGTIQDNKNDQIRKGRQPAGPTHGMFNKKHSKETIEKMSAARTRWHQTQLG